MMDGIHVDIKGMELFKVVRTRVQNGDFRNDLTIQN